MFIYKITNKINGKIYIGQTIRPIEIRFKAHCDVSSKSRAIHSAIKKYGKENFSLELVQECISMDDLNRMEVFWIRWFNCISPNGYNLTDGGNNQRPSNITKERLSINAKATWKNEETRAKRLSGFSKIWDEKRRANPKKIIIKKPKISFRDLNVNNNDWADELLNMAIIQSTSQS